MENFKESLRLVDPGHIISILENAIIMVEEIDLEAANESERLAIKHRLADLRIFGLIISGDLSIENISKINVRAVVKILNTCIEMEVVNSQVNKCLGNNYSCWEIDERIRDSRVLTLFLMSYSLNL